MPIDASPDQAAPTSTQTPRTTNTAMLPDPVGLGPGWAYRIEELDQDRPVPDTAFQERDPAEVVEMSIPMGCAARNTAPAPAVSIHVGP